MKPNIECSKCGSKDWKKDRGKIYCGKCGELFKCPRCDGNNWVYLDAVTNQVKKSEKDMRVFLCRHCETKGKPPLTILWDEKTGIIEFP
jgi:primosomal protein N'